MWKKILLLFNSSEDKLRKIILRDLLNRVIQMPTPIGESVVERLYEAFTEKQFIELRFLYNRIRAYEAAGFVSNQTEKMVKNEIRQLLKSMEINIPFTLNKVNQLEEWQFIKK